MVLWDQATSFTLLPQPACSKTLTHIPSKPFEIFVPRPGRVKFHKFHITTFTFASKRPRRTLPLQRWLQLLPLRMKVKTTRLSPTRIAFGSAILLTKAPNKTLRTLSLVCKCECYSLLYDVILILLAPMLACQNVLVADKGTLSSLLTRRRT